MSITKEYRIEDKNIEAALKKVEEAAVKGQKGNFEVLKGKFDGNITKLEEGKRYIDTDSSDPNIKRIITRIGNDAYETIMTKIDKVE